MADAATVEIAAAGGKKRVVENLSLIVSVSLNLSLIVSVSLNLSLIVSVSLIGLVDSDVAENSV